MTLGVSGSVMPVIPSLVCVPIFSIVMCIMYFNLRVEKEGLNSEMLSREVEDQEDYDSAFTAHFSETSHLSKSCTRRYMDKPYPR